MPVDPQAAALAAALRLPEPTGGIAQRMLNGSLMRVEAGPTDQFPALPMGFLEIFGAPAELLTKLRDAADLVIVSAAFRPGWPPMHEWCARGVAAMLAN